MAAFRKRQKDTQPVPAMEVMASVLAGLGAAPGQGETRARLQQLWLNWAMVMGPELAPLARPMGHHRDLLLIGAEDAMLAQELHLLAGEMLERVNAFMEQPFFTAIKVTLLMGKAGLDKTAASKAAPAGSAPRPKRPEPPNAHGLYLEAMDPSSPVARAYARFVRQRG
ncbi:DUF721 domain-containing protein [Desulfovibrio desulfuricans]|uniref:DUF721 domain-containing protein n=1 Tax=Desulfovibrio desulfuricans TaxID=876 RepID=A0A4P7UEU4_DESDE|nr:DUF721 domain-containing protein [Desulfovibrio desulfuricans]QCC84325.1 DUF721 domain-containing protein [Desulfovibrio desulfuricans]